MNDKIKSYTSEVESDISRLESSMNDKKSEIKPETKSEIKPESKSEIKTVIKSEIKSETKSENDEEIPKQNESDLTDIVEKYSNTFSDYIYKKEDNSNQYDC